MKRLLLIIIVLVTVWPGRAADMRNLLREMPDSILPLLTKVNRLDMLDFLNEGMKSVVVNRLDGKSELVEADEDYVRVRYSEKSEVCFRLFYFRDSVPMVCMVHTFGNELRDSRVRMFDSSWNEIDAARLLAVPGLDDFIVKGAARDSVARFKEVSQLRSIEAELSDRSNLIRFRYTGLGFLGQDSARYSVYVRQTPLEYKWNGKRFVKQPKFRM